MFSYSKKSLAFSFMVLELPSSTLLLPPPHPPPPTPPPPHALPSTPLHPSPPRPRIKMNHTKTFQVLCFDFSVAFVVVENLFETVL